MNFCYDRAQPVFLNMDTICDYFGAAKTTVGGKAAEIEKPLRLDRFERTLCRAQFADLFTLLEFPNGLVIPLSVARKDGLVPPDF
jgi:hypothetical protein